MSNMGFRDGKVIVKGINIEDESGEPGAVVTYTIAQCASAVSTGAILTGYRLKTAGTADMNISSTASFLGQPPYAMNIVLCATEIGHSLGGGLGDSDPFTLIGYDAMGNHIEETLYLATVNNGTTSTKHAFAHISTVRQRSGTVASSDDIGLSWGDIIGLPYPIATSDDIIAYTYGTAGASAAGIPPVGTNGYNTIHPVLMDDAVSMRVLYKTKLDL